MKTMLLKYVLQNAIKYDGKANVGSVIGKLIQEDPKIKNKIKEIMPELKKTIKEVEKISVKEQKKQLQKIAPELLKKKKHKEKELQDLPNAKKNQVVMRLAPFPSGPLHIGNAKPFILNDELVKKYNGKLLLVIDDTIGSKQKSIVKEAYKLIPEGLKLLDINFEEKIYYKSDRLETYYKYAEDIIKKGHAYVCTCPIEKMREYRKKAMVCECRNQNPEKALFEWNKMFKEYKEGEAVLRIKTGIDHPNPAFRDRVLFRISERIHPKVKNKYRVWPLLEFSWAIDDHLLGITHILRGKELMMETQMEQFIWDIFGWNYPEVIYSGLLQLEGIKISKSKSSKEVKSGEYFGWDDPRTWSLQSLIKRGITKEAIRKFILSFGINMNEITVPVESLYSENRKIVDPKAKRFFFIENPKKIEIKKAPEITTNIPLHPDKIELGVRKLKTNGEFYISENLKENQTYRFMHLFNFKNKTFLSKTMDPKIKAKLIHWLPKNQTIEAEILMPNSKIKKGLIEENAKSIKLNEIVQLERFGFVKLNKKEKNKLYFWFAHA